MSTPGSQEEKGQEGVEVKEESEVEKLRRTLKEEQEKANDYLNRLKYLQADFENYQKMIKKRMDDIVRFGNERLITRLLGVVDNLERAVEVGRDCENREALIEGVEITLKELREALRAEGLTEIEAVGKLFNPSFHEAAEKVEGTSFPDNTVTEELRKGYLLNGKVIRPSVVKVAK